MAVLHHIERLANVHPKLIAFSRKLAAASAIDVCVVTGVRDALSVAAKWNEGRVSPGPHAGEPGYPKLGLTVTAVRTVVEAPHAKRWTPEGYFGCAVDLQFQTEHGQLLDTDTPAHLTLYESLGLLAEAEGFVWGGHFSRRLDAGHVELKNWRLYPLNRPLA
jgi:hypothetical protein